MKYSILFWGFQDLNFVSEVARKARFSLNIKDFYIQINDLEKTVALMDLHPEEIIRTKYDLNNLYQWLVRCNKKDILVVVDWFGLVFQDNIEETCASINKILKLDFKFCFVAPKILHPQSLKFVDDIELSSIYQKTVEYTKIIKSLYETVINNNHSNSYIFASPIPEMVVLNRENYALFETKSKYNLHFYPKILKKFNAAYISNSGLAAKLVDSISHILFPTQFTHQFIFNSIEPDSYTSQQNTFKNNFSRFMPSISISLERFFLVRSGSFELTFILWLIYMSICEFYLQNEKHNAEPILAESFFSR